jgi:hypothetical protein
VLEDKVSGGTFEPKKYEVKTGRRKLDTEQIHSFCPPNII